MKMSYRKFAILSFVFTVLYYLIWMYLTKTIMGDERLTAGMHTTFLFVLPILLLSCAATWLKLWDFKEYRKVLIPTLIVLITPFLALQIIALFGCLLQGECF